MEDLLAKVGIITNKNMIPFDEKPPHVTSGLRLGTAALTTRGMGRKEMEAVGNIISSMLLNPEDKDLPDRVRVQVNSLSGKFPLFHEKWG